MTISREKISETLVAFCKPILDALAPDADLRAHEAAYQVGADVWNAHVYEALGDDPQAGAALERAESLAQKKELGLGHARGLQLVEELQRIKREQAPRDLRTMGEPSLSPSGGGWNLKVRELTTASAEDLQPIDEDPELAMVAAWERLIGAAKAVARLQPWNWLDETQNFGVLHPVSGELDWAKVSHGELGPTFELILGSEFQSAADLHDEVLTAEFVDREQLDAEDEEFLTAMGYELDAPTLWPVVRARYLDESEADLTFDEALTFAIALEQLHIVASRALMEPTHLLPDARGRLLARFPTRKTGDITWRDERVQPTQPALQHPALQQHAIFDREQAAHVRASYPSQRGKLECSVVNVPIEFNTQSGFVAPAIALFVESGSGELVHTASRSPDHILAQLPHALLEAVEQRAARPNVVLVSDPDIADALEPAITSLGIRLKLVDSLPEAERLAKAIAAEFERDPDNE